MFRYDLLRMKKALGVVVRIAWVATCILVLVNAHKGYRGTSDWQMEEGLAFQMLVLSFPSSFVVAVGLTLTGAMLGLFGLALPSPSKVEMTATWFLFVVAGYAQWFILLPSFLKRRKRSTEPQ
jgi:hypothetical protein